MKCVIFLNNFIVACPAARLDRALIIKNANKIKIIFLVR